MAAGHELSIDCETEALEKFTGTPGMDRPCQSEILQFAESMEIIWKQSSHIAMGDMVYLYVTAPVSAVLYRCEATEVDIPYRYDDGNVHMSRVMRLKKLEQYPPSFLPLEKLKSYGIGAVRGPRRMPHSLIYELERNQHEQ